MKNSVSRLPFDHDAVAGETPGAIDTFSHVDARVGLFASVGLPRVPLGAPLALSGWAFDRSSAEPPAAMTLMVDSTLAYSAETGFSRSDVKRLLGPGTPEKIGFRALVPTEQLGPGMHEVRAYALSADGAWYEAAHQAFSVHGAMRPELGVDSRRVRLHVESITDIALDGARGALANIVPAGHLASIEGWAVDLETRRAPAGVCVVDDAGGRWNGACDVLRSDVGPSAGALDDRLGFDLLIPADALGRGVHSLEVWVFDGEGKRLGRPCEAHFEIAAPMRPFPAFARELTEPAHASVLLRSELGTPVGLRSDRISDIKRDERVQIEGWALHGDGQPGQIILELQVPDVPIAPYRYFPVSGYHRKSPPRELREPPRDDAWFSYVLDPSNLAPHTYALSIVVVGGDGCSYARREVGMVRVVAERSEGSVRRT